MRLVQVRQDLLPPSFIVRSDHAAHSPVNATVNIPVLLRCKSSGSFLTRCCVGSDAVTVFMVHITINHQNNAF